MNFFRKNIKAIIGFVVGVILASGVTVYAYNYIANEVMYTKKDGSEISVEDALNELYSKTSNTTLLWTNPNSTSDFPAQTIELDLSKYDGVFIQTSYATNTTANYCLEANCVLINVGETGKTLAADDNAAFHSLRDVNVSTTGVSFSNGKVFGYNLSSSTGASYGIPLKIYGIKY